MAHTLTPPWLYLLNAMQKEWRIGELLKNRDPDPFLERQLRAKGAWPPAPDLVASGAGQLHSLH